MRAIIRQRYGAPSVLKLAEVEVPTVREGAIVVQVRAGAANPFDWHVMRGSPFPARLAAGLLRPRAPGLGVDFAGVVSRVGAGVTGYKVGDAVFGTVDDERPGSSMMAMGAFAEYVCVDQSRVQPKPHNVSFEQASGVCMAGLCALQALRDLARVQSGDRVLVNGASGGIGTFTVQLAKSMGAEVIAVCSGRNAELVRSLGADTVIDYTAEDFVERVRDVDVFIDNVGNRRVRDCIKTMNRLGTYVAVGGLRAPLRHVLRTLLLRPFVSQRLVPLFQVFNAADLAELARLMEQGKLEPVVDRTFPLERTREAITYLESFRARGKVVVVP